MSLDLELSEELVHPAGPGGFVVTPKGLRWTDVQVRPLTASLQEGRGARAGTVSLAGRLSVLRPGPCPHPSASSPKESPESPPAGSSRGLWLWQSPPRVLWADPVGSCSLPVSPPCLLSIICFPDQPMTTLLGCAVISSAGSSIHRMKIDCGHQKPHPPPNLKSWR